MQNVRGIKMVAKRVLSLLFSLFVLSATLAFANGAKEKTSAASSQGNSATSMQATTVSSGMYGGTLNLGGSAPTMIVSTFNPFSPNTDPGVYFVYEPLMYVNPLNGNTIPFLAASYKWTDNNLKMDVTLRSGVKWNDGTPFTSEDVAFTFNLLKKYPALDLNGIWSKLSDLSSVDASGPNQVVFTFSEPNVPEAFYILRTVIVPQHVWSQVSDPVKFLNADHPVGTGPFIRASYSVANNVETFTKRSSYWQKDHPYIDEIRLIGNVSNQAAFLQLRRGDTVQNDIGGIDPKRNWVDLDPKTRIAFWPTYTTNNLWFNDTKAPFNNPIFRKAVALAIDKHALEDRMFFGSGGYDISQTGIIPGQRQQWYDSGLKSLDSTFKYDPQKAMSLLESIGYKKVSGELVGPDGQPLPSFGILVGSGWTAFITGAQFISQELGKNLGIHATIQQEAGATRQLLLRNGNFDMAIGWAPQTGPTPYFTYESQLYSKFSAPIGKPALSNYIRFSSPVVDKALTEFAHSSDPAVQKQAMNDIQKVMVNEVPFVVLQNRTGLDLYNSADFVGWPSVENSYSNGWNGSGLGMLPVVLRLHKRS